MCTDGDVFVHHYVLLEGAQDKAAHPVWRLLVHFGPKNFNLHELN